MQGGSSVTSDCPKCGEHTLVVVEFVQDGISGTDLYDQLGLLHQGKYFCTSRGCKVGGGIPATEDIKDYLEWTLKHIREEYQLGPEGSKKAK
jgi:hypothetical protein